MLNENHHVDEGAGRNSSKQVSPLRGWDIDTRSGYPSQAYDYYYIEPKGDRNGEHGVQDFLPRGFSERWTKETKTVATDDEGVDDGHSRVQQEYFSEAGKELNLRAYQGEDCQDGGDGRTEDGDSDEGNGRHDPLHPDRGLGCNLQKRGGGGPMNK